MWHWNWFLAASLSPAGQGCLSFALGTMEKVGVLVPRGFLSRPCLSDGGRKLCTACHPSAVLYIFCETKGYISQRLPYVHKSGFNCNAFDFFFFFSLPFDIFIWSQSLLTNQTILCCYSDRVVFVAPLQFIVICCFYIMVKSLTHSRNLRRPI